jgi:hypothetical protein
MAMRCSPKRDASESRLSRMRRWSISSSAMRSATGSRKIPTLLLPASWCVSGSDPLSRLTERAVGSLLEASGLRLERVSRQERGAGVRVLY